MSEAHDHLKTVSHNPAFAIGFALNVGLVAVEGTLGVMAGSLALLADAGHNLTDVLALLLAWGANALLKRRPSERRTYGWRKTSILAALINASILLIVIGGIGWEALERLSRPPSVEGKVVLWVALIAVIINTLTALFFFAGRKTDLNIRGVFLHMAADAGVSAGVALAGLGIFLTGWLWIDPTVSLAVVVVILISTWTLFKESLNLAMDAVPAHIDTEAVRAFLCSLPGITAVHDLHIWALSTRETALTAHLVKPDTIEDDALLNEAPKTLRERFGIDHVTLQLEREAGTLQCERQA